MALGISQLSEVIIHAKNILKNLQEKHSGLRCNLVFSSRFGQCGLKTGLDLFNEFHEMFLPEELVSDINLILKDKKKIEKRIKIKTEELDKHMKDFQGRHSTGVDKEFAELKKKSHEIDMKVKELLLGLSIRDDVFVELRFDQLNFELIEKLKKDPLLNQAYIEPEKRSIRIVVFRVNEIEATGCL